MLLNFRRVRLFSLALAVVFLTSCASYFKRKDCEKTDWHAYGKSVAMSGKRLTGDTFVNSCEKVEAKIDYSAMDVGFKMGMDMYCQPETVYATGRSGQPFNSKMCDGGSLKDLLKKHEEGVTAFCQPDNAYRVGAQGVKYNNICPQSMEKAFYSEYEKGRKVYLTGQVEQKEEAIKVLDKQINDNQKLMTAHSSQLASLPVIAPRERPKGKQSPYSPEEQKIINERSRLNSKISQVERQIRSDQAAQTKLREEIGQLKTELASLQRE